MTLRHAGIRSLAAAFYLALAVWPDPVSPQQADVATVAIQNVSVVDVRTGSLSHEMSVVITGDRIAEIGPTASLELPAGAHLLEGRGKYLIPGLVDTHVHLDLPALSSERDTLTFLASLLSRGITGVREANAGVRNSDLLALRRIAEEQGLLLPRIYVSVLPDSAALAELNISDVLSAMERLRSEGVHGIKIMHESRERSLEIIRAARQAGLPVYGHTSTILRHRGPGQEHFALEAVRAGLSGIVHMSWLDIPDRTEGPIHLEPRLVPSVPRYESEIVSRWRVLPEPDMRTLIEEMVRRDVWLEPTLTVLYHDHSVFEGRCTEGPPIGGLRGSVESARLTGGEAAEALRACDNISRFIRAFVQEGGMILAGSDYPPFGVDEEMVLLVRGGLSPLTALQAATLNPAIAFGIESDLGVVEAGKLADLVLLHSNPLDDIRNVTQVAAVIAGGRLQN